MHFPRPTRAPEPRCYLVTLSLKTLFGAHFTAHWWLSSSTSVLDLLGSTFPAPPPSIHTRHSEDLSYFPKGSWVIMQLLGVLLLPGKLRLILCGLLLYFSVLSPDYELLKHNNLLEIPGHGNILSNEWSFVIGCTHMCSHTCTHTRTHACVHRQAHTHTRGCVCFSPCLLSLQCQALGWAFYVHFLISSLKPILHIKNKEIK